MRLTREHLLAICLISAGCDPKTTIPGADFARGSATACLDAGGAASRGADETATFDITGTVVSDEAGAVSGDVHPCQAASRVLTLLGSDGVTWQVGYGLADAEGTDITPAMEVEADANVYLRFVSVQSFGEAAGFVVQDTDSVIGALEVGTWGTTLGASDFPGLTVEVGDFDGLGHDGCGDTEGYDLNFVGDAARTLTPVEDKLITVGSKAYTAYALSAWAYTEAECTDVAGETIWAVFR